MGGAADVGAIEDEQYPRVGLHLVTRRRCGWLWTLPPRDACQQLVPGVGPGPGVGGTGGWAGEVEELCECHLARPC